MTGPGEDDDTDLVILHRHPQYADACMEILNAEWPRSTGLRLRSLRSSCDQFPTSLVLLRGKNSKKEEVVGHAKVNVLPREENAAWIESVIIRNDLRGKGYGRILMTKTEEFSKACGFTMAYLSTHDQQKFYAKLGYEFCPPVCIYGGSVNRNIIPKEFMLPQTPKEVLSVSKASELCRMLSTQCSTTEKKAILNNNPSDEQNKCLVQNSQISPNVPNSVPAATSAISPNVPNSVPSPSSIKSSHAALGPPPPPPPPPPASSKLSKNDIHKLDVNTTSKMYMRKSLIK
ncbi:N-alpha-acetyltransferase 80 [Palaemon carinicauda]|uniref:N-alpha-acetyltransferase 80 n=1 Tax=Palaemon carinicauda TaxID=392227 RepID=UPI0035B5E557